MWMAVLYAKRWTMPLFFVNIEKKEKRAIMFYKYHVRRVYI